MAGCRDTAQIQERTDGDLLREVGIDGSKWAEAFMRLHIGKLLVGEEANPKTQVDEADMLGWFSNAIMAGFDEAERRQRVLRDAATALSQPDVERLVKQAQAIDAKVRLKYEGRIRELTERAESAEAKLAAALAPPSDENYRVACDLLAQVLASPLHHDENGHAYLKLRARSITDLPNLINGFLGAALAAPPPHLNTTKGD